MAGCSRQTRLRCRVSILCLRIVVSRVVVHVFLSIPASASKWQCFEAGSTMQPCSARCGYCILDPERFDLVEYRSPKRQTWWEKFCCYRCWEAQKTNPVQVSSTGRPSPVPDPEAHGRLCSNICFGCDKVVLLGAALKSHICPSRSELNAWEQQIYLVLPPGQRFRNKFHLVLLSCKTEAVSLKSNSLCACAKVKPLSS